MQNALRIRVAAVVGAALSNRTITSVFDFGSSQSIPVSVKVTNSGSIEGFDFSTSTHISGTNNKLNFFDYETSNHVQLSVDKNSFNGFDYDSGHHFSGTVNSNTVVLFDHETSQYYHFTPN